jgi:UDP-N-acetylglucosamine 3-dehydrogenase
VTAAGTRPLRAGLIGLGSMGGHHARVLTALAGVRLVGAVDPLGDPQGRARGVPVFREVEQLIALGVDYAVVACPTACHEQVALELARAGVCALIEKPVADSVEGARRIVEAFESRGVVAGVGHIERCNPALISLRGRLRSGDLGDVGVVKDLATHDIDLTSWVTGQAYTSVSARTVCKSGRPHEDMVVAVGQLGDGTMVNHLVNWLSPLKERYTSVTGEKGCFVADTLTADLTFYSNAAQTTEWEALMAFRGVAEGDMIRYAIPKREPLLVEHEMFRDAVLGGGGDICTLRQGLRTVEVAAAVLESASGGVTVTLPDARQAPEHAR